MNGGGGIGCHGDEYSVKSDIMRGGGENLNQSLFQPWFANVNKRRLCNPNEMLILEWIETPLNLHHSLFCRFCGRARPRMGRKEGVNGKRGGGGRGGGEGEKAELH